MFFAKTLDKSGYLCYNAYIYKFSVRQKRQKPVARKVHKPALKLSFFQM